MDKLSTNTKADETVAKTNASSGSNVIFRK